MSFLPKNINARYELISKVLEQNKGNVSQTAQRLRITGNCVKTIQQ